ncbi:MAG: polynucleotide kinase-phosphatase [Bacteroidota bacterium]
MNRLHIPELSLVLLVGPTSSGKSSFAAKHFLPTEVVSSDFCRALVDDDENSMDATQDAFDLLHYMVGKRLKRGKLTVVDATNVQPEARKSLIRLAREYHCLPVAIAFDLPEKILLARHQQRDDRNFGRHVIINQSKSFRRSLRQFKKEGFRKIFVLKSEESIEAVEIKREPLWNNKKHESGPFDIIGDVHGCFAELCSLMSELGYEIEKNASKNYGYSVKHPENRRLIFVGDLVDRGPDSPNVLRIVMSMVQEGIAFCVPGNHDVKLQRKLNGKDVKLRHGLAETMAQLANEPESFLAEVKEFIYKLVSHLVFDEGKLVVAHAGIIEEMQGRGSGAVKAFCLYGETNGEIDEFGLPVRYNWAAEYKGKAMVVYGHTPIPEPEWLNYTLNIDTGCVFGGKLTALRYPEKEVVSTDALAVYCEPVRPLEPVQEERSAQQANDDLLEISQVTGKRLIQPSKGRAITIREPNSIAALEVISRFGVHPQWMIYLPPTMSPTETSKLEGYLEHPQQALAYYKDRAITEVVCEEKHMGSRAIVIVCKEPKVAQSRFGLQNEYHGIVYTRTGRKFFNDTDLEAAFLKRLRKALDQSGFWEELETDWVCLDTELMPWSAKAQSLIKQQYASVGAAGTAAYSKIEASLAQAKERGLDIESLRNRFETKTRNISRYRDAYRAYCHEVHSLDDYKLAPFHILATEGQTHTDKTHIWHMEQIARFCAADPHFLIATPFKHVDLNNEDAVAELTQWWVDMTGKGGEGMVVKPLNFIAKGKKGIIQPAIKCRGSEYLRIIYGPDYTESEHLKRLRNRKLARKRGLAKREFTLGLEALERFVAREPLRRTHECVFGVLALESEAVDPRL